MAEDRQRATRTSAIADAIRQELSARRERLDADDKLGEVTVTVKLQAGTSWVRGVVWQEERVCRVRG